MMDFNVFRIIIRHEIKKKRNDNFVGYFMLQKEIHNKKYSKTILSFAFTD